MYQSRLLGLFICFTSGCLLVSLLYELSTWKEAQPNAFLRKLPPHRIIGSGFVKLGDKNHYFAGIDSGFVYLGSWSRRNVLLKLNYRTKDTTTIKLSGLDTIKFFRGVYTRTENNKLYLFDGVKPAIVTGDLLSGQLTDISHAPFFTSAVPINTVNYVLRVINKNQRNTLVKFARGKTVANYVLEKQGDGIFSTDGALLKNQDGTRLFYGFYYRNRFLCLDTNLKILYRGKTIDTVNYAKIKLSKINSLGEITIAAPPQFVNEQCAANKQYLFIHSALKADNETAAEMKEAAPIDIYWIKDSKYAFSVYVDNMNNEKLRDFRVYDKTLIALYDHYVYIYELKF